MRPGIDCCARKRSDDFRNRLLGPALRRGRVTDELVYSFSVRSCRLREDRPSPAREEVLYLLKGAGSRRRRPGRCLRPAMALRTFVLRAGGRGPAGYQRQRRPPGRSTDHARAPAHDVARHAAHLARRCSPAARGPVRTTARGARSDASHLGGRSVHMVRQTASLVRLQTSCAAGFGEGAEGAATLAGASASHVLAVGVH